MHTESVIFPMQLQLPVFERENPLIQEVQVFLPVPVHVPQFLAHFKQIWLE